MRRALIAVVACACGKGSPSQSSPGHPVRLGTPISLGAPIASRSGGIAALAATPDGARVVTADVEPNPETFEKGGAPGIVIWDARTWTIVATLGTAYSRAVAISDDGAIVASADEDGQIRVWNVATKAPVHALALPGAVAVWTDGTRVIAAARDGRVQEWDREGRATRAVKATHDVRVAAIAGDRIAVSGLDGAELLSLPKPPGAAGHVALAVDGKAYVLAFSRDGAHLAAGSEHGPVDVFAAATGAREAEYGDRSGWPAHALAVAAPDRVVLAIPTQGQNLRVLPDGPLLTGDESFENLAIVDGARAVIGSTFEGAIRRFALDGSAARAGAHTGRIARVAFVGDAVVSGGPWPGGGFLRRWDLATRTSQPVEGRAVVSPSGRLRATFDDEAGELLVVDAAGKVVAAAKIDGALDTTMVFSADERRLVIASSDKATVVELATRAIRTWPLGGDPQGDVLQALAMSHDGALVATARGSGAIEIWDAATGKRTRELASNVLNTSFLAFTPHGLASATESHGIQLWNLADGNATTLYAGDGKGIQGSSDAAYAADVSDDGALLVTGHGSGVVRLWDLATGKQLASANEHHAIVTALDLAPDGARLVTGDGNGRVLVWPVAR